MVDKELLNILCCPKCKSEIEEVGEEIVCQNSECGLRYPIKEDIPVMLIEEAEATSTSPSSMSDQLPGSQGN